MRKQDLFDRFLEGKKNSLGQVPSILKEILDHQITIDDVYDLYAEEHPIVSMRISNLMKRLWREDGKLIKPYIDNFIEDASRLKNPTFRWTIAQIFTECYHLLSDAQKQLLLDKIKENLMLGNDWIMLAQSLASLEFAMKKRMNILDSEEILRKIAEDDRRSVSSKAKKILDSLND